MKEQEFTVGDKVRKSYGYLFSGVIVSVFKTLGEGQRVVVECTVAGANGILHIFNPKQLEHDDQ
jgi:hypothetical protein